MRSEAWTGFGLTRTCVLSKASCVRVPPLGWRRWWTSRRVLCGVVKAGGGGGRLGGACGVAEGAEEGGPPLRSAPCQFAKPLVEPCSIFKWKAFRNANSEIFVFKRRRAQHCIARLALTCAILDLIHRNQPSID